MKKFLIGCSLLFMALLAYFFTWPVPIAPVAWHAPNAPSMTGVYAENTQLAEFDAVSLDGLHGPEAVVGNASGALFTTTEEGWILRWSEAQDTASRWLEVGGRPLGIDFDDAQNLWVANAFLGLQKVTPAGALSLELDTADGVPIRYADDVVVAPSGKIYISDASTKFSAKANGDVLKASLLDIMEHGGHGRIIEFDPMTKLSKVIMRGLNFANGVTVDKSGEFLLVCETGSYRVWKYWLMGDKAGQSEILIDNLPGFPDNIHGGFDGRYWLGLTTPRSKDLDGLSMKPTLRKIVQRLPSFMRPQVQHYGHVLAIDENGQVLASLQDPEGRYPATTGVWETTDYLYIGSLQAEILARIEKRRVAF